MMSPCKGCEKSGCGAYHNQCEAYQKFLAKQEEINHRKRMEREVSWLSRQQEVKHWKNLKLGRTVSRR